MPLIYYFELNIWLCLLGHILAIAAGAMGAEGAAATAETVTGVDARDAIETKRRKGTEHATRIKTEVKTRLRKRGEL